jgi:acyl homoserine lactone synthase
MTCSACIGAAKSGVDAFSVETAHLYGCSLLTSAYQLRYRIFVERQKYDVPHWKGIEWDQFDTPAATYLLWRDDHGAIRGIVRLLPTSYPYMIQCLCPDWAREANLPASHDVWEISRFGVDPVLDRKYQRRVFRELVCSLGEFGLTRDIREYIFAASPSFIEHAIGVAGVCWMKLGSVELGGSTSTIGRVSVTIEALHRIRLHHDIRQQVMRPNAPCGLYPERLGTP